MIWLLACQAASARTFVLCQDSCCTDEFCGPVQVKRLCTTEAMMCGLIKYAVTLDSIEPPKPFSGIAVVLETEPRPATSPEPLVYFNSLKHLRDSFPTPPPVPPPESA